MTIKKNGPLWEFGKHLPSYQPLKILNAGRRLSYFCDHSDHSSGQTIVTVSSLGLATFMLGSVELNHSCVGEESRIWSRLLDHCISPTD